MPDSPTPSSAPGSAAGPDRTSAGRDSDSGATADPDPTSARPTPSGQEPVAAAPFTSTVVGYPRIGPRRELKFALEKYWAGTMSAADLEQTAAMIRRDTRAEIAGAGVQAVPGNTFSYYDQMLDTAVLVGAVPQRYRDLGLSRLDTYCAMARGRHEAGSEIAALEMTKWFDTNYHYLVPEIGPDTAFRLDAAAVLGDVAEAAQQGIAVRPVLIGPLTFLLLSKPEADAPEDFSPVTKARELMDVYTELLGRLADAGVEWVQLDEPAYVADRTEAELAALDQVYSRLATLSHRPKLLVAGYFGDLGPALEILAGTGVESIAVDLVAGPAAAERIRASEALADVHLVAGVVDGRNVWATDLSQRLALAQGLAGRVRSLAVSTSCSLLHVPYDLAAETDLPAELVPRLAFARQKLTEVAVLGAALGADPAAADEVERRTDRLRDALGSVGADPAVRDRVAGLTEGDRQRGDYSARSVAQQQRLGLPALATTTIGSFPQTAELRRARADLRAGRLDDAGYADQMRAEVDRVIALQEQLGLDVLVHGEPERNDMVQYFGEQLAGFAFTRHGWVQSYGSRCVRPPILFGDVSRPRPMTVPWASYAQSRTGKPVKGMLTGPVTILAWSFVRDDQPLSETADQVALALRDEVADLAAAGIAVIQVDEPALRELLPLRHSEQAEYLRWAVDAFRLATGGADDATAIHTHLCYSEFGEVIGAIDRLDADVTSIEAARSNMEVLDDLRRASYRRGVGPGVYDIHSPRVPSVEELTTLVTKAVGSVAPQRLWVNPDCGLKTRRYEEVEPALRHLVAAAERVRATVPAS